MPRGQSRSTHSTSWPTSARKAAIGIGCYTGTVMWHYGKLDEQAVTDEVMGQLAVWLTTKPNGKQGEVA
jgi:hypothetical protein